MPKKKGTSSIAVPVDVEWKDLEKFVANLENLLNTKLVPVVSRSTVGQLSRMLGYVTSSMTCIRNRDIRIVVTGPQGSRKTDLINRMLCGTRYIVGELSVKPLIARAAGRSVTCHSMSIKKATKFRLIPTFCSNDEVAARCLKEGWEYVQPVSRNLLPEGLENVPLDEQMECVSQTLQGMHPVERLALESFALEGPFPNLPERVVLVDTPGFGHEDDGDKHGRKAEELLRREFSTADVIFAVTQRIVDSVTLEVLRKLGAFQEKSRGQIPLLVSAYPENNMTHDEQTADLKVLKASVNTTASKVLPSTAMEFFSQQRIFTFLEKNAVLFQRIHCLSDSTVLHKKMEEICKIVRRLDIEIFSQFASTFLTSCTAAVTGLTNLQLKKFDKSHAKLMEVDDKIFWQGERELKQDVLTQHIKRLLMDFSAPEDLYTAMGYSFQEHVKDLVRHTSDYIKSFLTSFSSMYVKKVMDPSNLGPYLKDNAEGESDMQKEMQEWLLELLNTESDSPNPGEHYLLENPREIELFVTNYIAKLNLHEILGDPIAIVHRVAEIFELDMNIEENQLEQELNEEAGKISLALFSSKYYASLITTLKSDADGVLTRVLNCVKAFSTEKVPISSDNQKLCRDAIARVKNDWHKNLVTNYIQQNSSLPIRTATDSLPQEPEVESIIQAIRGHTASKNPIDRLDTGTNAPITLTITEDVRDKQNVLEVNLHDTPRVSMHPTTARTIRDIARDFVPKNLKSKRFIYPLFVPSWAASEELVQHKDLWYTNLDGLPHAIFVVAEKKCAQWYINKLKDLPNVFVVKVMRGNVPAQVLLQLCQSIAEYFDFPFWWRATEKIESVAEFMREILKSRKCTMARAMLYGQHVLNTLHVHVFDTVSRHLKDNMFVIGGELFRISGRLYQNMWDEETHDAIQKCMQLMQELDTLSYDAIVTLVDLLRIIVQAIKEAEQARENDNRSAEEIRKSQKYLETANNLETVLHECRMLLQDARRCGMLTYVHAQFQTSGIWSHYPHTFHVIAHRTGFNDIALNSTFSQKGYLHALPSRMADTRQTHRTITTFYENISAAESQIANKLYKSHHNGICLYNFARKIKSKEKIEAENASPIKGAKNKNIHIAQNDRMEEEQEQQEQNRGNKRIMEDEKEPDEASTRSKKKRAVREEDTSAQRKKKRAVNKGDSDEEEFKSQANLTHNLGHMVLRRHPRPTKK